MSQTGGIWRFAAVLRVLVLMLVVIYGLFFLIIWGLALAGETEGAFDFIDIDSDTSLAAWQIMGGIFCSGVEIIAMAMIAWSASQFIVMTRSRGFFIKEVPKTCRTMGYGLITFWAGMLLTENFLPWIMTRGLPKGQQEDIIWFLLDANLIALMVGIVLLLMAQAIDEARVIDNDNKQFI